MVEPADLIEEYVRAYNDRDLQRIGRLLAPDFSIETPNHSLRVGAATYLEGLEREWSSYAACRLDLRTVTADRERAVMEAVWSFTTGTADHASSGRPDGPTRVLLPQLGVWNVESGVFSSARLYWDSLGFRGQLGLAVSDAVLQAQAAITVTRSETSSTRSSGN